MQMISGKLAAALLQTRHNHHTANHLLPFYYQFPTKKKLLTAYVYTATTTRYGDLAVYGHPTSVTPAIDGLARDGLRFTQWYVWTSFHFPLKKNNM